MKRDFVRECIVDWVTYLLIIPMILGILFVCIIWPICIIGLFISLLLGILFIILSREREYKYIGSFVYSCKWCDLKFKSKEKLFYCSRCGEYFCSDCYNQHSTYCTVFGFFPYGNRDI